MTTSAFAGVAIVLSVISFFSLILVVVLLPYLVIRLPEDYFARPRRSQPWAGRTLREKLWAIARGVFGAVLIFTGAFLVVLPGQGILTILMGLVVAEFPGKFKLEQRIVERPAIRRGLNAIRKRFDRPPLLHAPGLIRVPDPSEVGEDPLAPTPQGNPTE